MYEEPQNNRHRDNFFDYSLPNEKIRQCLTGAGEYKVDWLLSEVLGYKEKVDYFRQYAIENLYVADFVFPKYRLIIECDGKNHRKNKQRRKDAQRDWVCNVNGWYVVRIREENFDKNARYYKSLIYQVIEHIKLIGKTYER